MNAKRFVYNNNWAAVQPPRLQLDAHSLICFVSFTMYQKLGCNPLVNHRPKVSNYWFTVATLLCSWSLFNGRTFTSSQNATISFCIMSRMVLRETLTSIFPSAMIESPSDTYVERSTTILFPLSTNFTHFS